MSRTAKAFLLSAVLVAAFGLASYAYLAIRPPAAGSLLARMFGGAATEQGSDADRQDVSQSLGSILNFMNSDSASRLAFVSVSERGEGLAAFVDPAGPDGRETISQLVVRDGKQQTGVIEVSADGWPESFSYRGYTVRYSGFSPQTVDLTVEQPNGLVQSFPSVPVRLDDADEPAAAAGRTDRLGLVPAAQAAEVESGAAPVGPAPAGPRDSQASRQYYPHTVAQLLNLTFCTIGATTATLGTGGWGAPLLISCGTLITRGVTGLTGYGNCAGDIVECSNQALAETLRQHGPGFLKDGFRIKGQLVNSVTGHPVTVGVILSETSDGQDGPRGDWESDGRFDLYFGRPGRYSVRAVADGFAEADLDVEVGGEAARLFLADQEQGIEIKYPANWIGQAYGEYEMAWGLQPDGYVQGQVISSDGGDSLEGATVTVYDGAERLDQDQTDSEGLFRLQPPVLGQELRRLRVTATAAGFASQEAWLALSYDLQPRSDLYDLGDWDGMFRLSPGLELWEISTKAVDGCLDLGTFYIKVDGSKPQAMAFGSLCPNSQNSCVLYDLEGTVTVPGPADFGLPSLFGGILYQLTGTFGTETGQGALKKPIPEGTSSGERHHYTECDSSWTAKKVVR